MTLNELISMNSSDALMLVQIAEARRLGALKRRLQEEELKEQSKRTKKDKQKLIL